MRLLSKRFGRPGTAPGTLRAPDVQRVERVQVRLMRYGPDGLEERDVAPDEDLHALVRGDSVTWIDVVGLHDLELLQRIGDAFALHPLALEDVLNVGQRSKVEDYDSHLFVVMKLLRLSPDLEVEQIAAFLGAGWLVTFQEVPGDAFDPVRERIRKGKGKIRGAGSDYLAYALIDALVDQFFPILEEYGERIEDLEDELVKDPDRETLQKIHQLKKELLVLRRAAWPQREVVSSLERTEPPLVRPETRLFLRDCYDHTIQVMDMLETYRDLASGMLDVYLSSVSNRMNEVMKVLTVMASIFIPLTFVVGLYGMNFDPRASRWNMPELEWAYGYPAVWALMLAIVVVMVWIFRRKRWI